MEIEEEKQSTNIEVLLWIIFITKIYLIFLRLKK